MAIQSSFRRTLVLSSLVFSIVACSSNEPTQVEQQQPATPAESVSVGQQVFESNCVTCHGVDGKLGLSGAKDLSKSTLTAEEMKTVIQNGRNGMPSFEGIIPDGPQLDSLISVVLSLRK